MQLRTENPISGISPKKVTPSSANPNVVVVANNSTLDPVTSQPFSFFTFPAISNGEVAFVGTSGQHPQNIYKTVSGIVTVSVRNGEVAPDGGTFTALGLPFMNQNQYVFSGSTTQHSGIYLKPDNGAVSMIVNTATTIPGQSTPFHAFDGTPVVKGQVVAFQGSSSAGYQGIFTSMGGTLKLIADNTMSIPGGTGNFMNLSSPAIAPDGIAFFGGRGDGTYQGLQCGIYFNDGTGLKKLVDNKTSVPGGGTFSGFTNIVYTGNAFAFYAQTSGGTGIYTVTSGGVITKIADNNTLVPGGSGYFSGFYMSAPAAFANTVSFQGYDSNSNPGLYALQGTTLIKLIDSSNTIGGSTITYFGYAMGDYEVSEITFYAVLQNNSFGIYKLFTMMK